jgi:putative copper export protein
VLLKLVVFIHILSATIWVGGHLILSITYLPNAVKQNDYSLIEAYESRFERIGIPALLLSLATGIYLITVYAPDLFQFDLSDHYTRHIVIKLILFLSTIILAVHARFFLIPKRKIKPLSYHIIAVTLIGIAFVLVGMSARMGGIL